MGYSVMKFASVCGSPLRIKKKKKNTIEYGFCRF